MSISIGAKPSYAMVTQLHRSPHLTPRAMPPIPKIEMLAPSTIHSRATFHLSALIDHVTQADVRLQTLIPARDTQQMSHPLTIMAALLQKHGAIKESRGP